MDKAKVVNQIKTMLDIATRDTTPIGEAEAAMAKAHQLMEKYAIELHELQGISEESLGKMGSKFGTFCVAKKKWASLLAVPVGKMFMTYTVRMTDDMVAFYGAESDIEMASYTFDALANMIEARAVVDFKNFAQEYKVQTGKSYWTIPGVQARRAKHISQFQKGAVIGFIEAIRKAQEDARKNNTQALVAMTSRYDKAVSFCLSQISTKQGRAATLNGSSEAFQRGKVYGGTLNASKALNGK